KRQCQKEKTKGVSAVHNDMRTRIIAQGAKGRRGKGKPCVPWENWRRFLQIRNSKLETRNSKQIPMIKAENPKLSE
ncbi:MAG: hypothetical protein DMG09_15150, partial [Acidobacteria bacterium]